tara:strand:+ start:1961 stop:2083 length:123 start_codon:yes stop_codon:yes gene_type:complete
MDRFAASASVLPGTAMRIGSSRHHAQKAKQPAISNSAASG